MSGKENVFVDALSRLDNQSEQETSPEENGFLQAHVMTMMIRDESIETPESSEEIARYCYCQDMMETEEFPLSPKVIAREQEGDRNLRHARRQNPNIGVRTVEGERLLTLGNKIMIPNSLER